MLYTCLSLWGFISSIKKITSALKTTSPQRLRTFSYINIFLCNAELLRDILKLNYPKETTLTLNWTKVSLAYISKDCHFLQQRFIELIAVPFHSMGFNHRNSVGTHVLSPNRWLWNVAFQKNYHFPLCSRQSQKEKINKSCRFPEEEMSPWLPLLTAATPSRELKEPIYPTYICFLPEGSIRISQENHTFNSYTYHL